MPPHPGSEPQTGRQSGGCEPARRGGLPHGCCPSPTTYGGCGAGRLRAAAGQPPAASRDIPPAPRPAIQGSYQPCAGRPRKGAGPAPAGRPPRRLGCGGVLGMGLFALAVSDLRRGRSATSRSPAALPSPRICRRGPSEFASTRESSTGRARCLTRWLTRRTAAARWRP